MKRFQLLTTAIFLFCTLLIAGCTGRGVEAQATPTPEATPTATADILSSLPDSAKITVIDHTGDLKFDAVLVTSVRPATVAGTDPLTVRLGTTERPAERFAQTDVFAAGQSVLYCEVRGMGYIRAE